MQKELTVAYCNVPGGTDVKHEISHGSPCPGGDMK